MKREIVEKWLADKKRRRMGRGDDSRSLSGSLSARTESHLIGTPKFKMQRVNRLNQINEDDAESSFDSRNDGGRPRFDFYDDIDLRINRKEHSTETIDVLALTQCLGTEK